MGQARARILHLLRQVNANPAMTGVQGLRVLANSWRNPDRAHPLATVGHPVAYTPPGLEPASTAHLPVPIYRHREGAAQILGYRRETRPASELDGLRRNQPRAEAQPSEHRAWMTSYQDRIPLWMERNATGGPTLSSAEFWAWARWPLARNRAPAERGVWLNRVNVLFSVPGLYRRITELGGYPIGAEWQLRRYPSPISDNSLSIFHVAFWYAQMGMTFDMASRIQRTAYRARAAHHGMDLEEPNLQFEGPRAVTDVTNVPTIQELGFTATGQPAPPIPPATNVSPQDREVEPGQIPPSSANPAPTGNNVGQIDPQGPQGGSGGNTAMDETA
ncbi:hypothetical protein BV20DRAFT_941780 [Pilatotrama ljubarskyi]|nr:hypothetical protein BV20DRAFT_941780 [Pilatotrama ljubarskyi]